MVELAASVPKPAKSYSILGAFAQYASSDDEEAPHKPAISERQSQKSPEPTCTLEPAIEAHVQQPVQEQPQPQAHVNQPLTVAQMSQGKIKIDTSKKWGKPKTSQLE